MRGPWLADPAADPADEVVDLAEDLVAGEFVDGEALGVPSAELAVPAPMVLEHRGSPAVVPLTVAERVGQRARQLPYVATAGTGIVGTTAWYAAEVAAAAGVPALSGGIIVGTWVATGAGVGAVRVWLRNRIPDTWRRTWWTSVIGAAAGVDAVVAAGPAALVGVAVAGAAVATGSGWMAAHKVPAPRPALPPPPRAIALPTPPPPSRRRPVITRPKDAATIAHERWDARVATGIVRGAELRDREDIPHATRWLGVTPPGSTTFADVHGQRARIAGALQTSVDRVVIERYPGDESLFWFTLVTRDHLAEGVPYYGPEYRDGLVRIGDYADGGEPVEVIAWQKGQGTRNLASIGQMGSGKTALLELTMLGLKSPGVWRCWWGDGDPQGGSSNIAEDAADWYEASPEGLLRQLAAFEALLDSRGDQIHLLAEDPETGDPVRRRRGQKRLREFKPTVDHKGYMWFLPELATLLGNEQLHAAKFGPRLREVLRRHRKYGIGVGIDTQTGGMGDFGGDATLKHFLTMTNAFCMRSTDPAEQYMMNGIQVSPGLLPDTGGYGLRANGGRLAPFRTAWVHNLHDYLPGLPVTQDDPDAADAIRPYLPSRDPEQSLAESEARMAARRSAARGIARGGLLGPDGLPITPADDSTPATAAAPAPNQTPSRPRGAGVTVQVGDPDTVRSTVHVLHPPAEAVAPAPSAASTTAIPAHTANSHRVLAMLRSRPGPWTTGQLETATGLAKSAVSKALGVLVQRGEAWRPKGTNGTYQAVQGTPTSPDHATA
jgi:hypothetical protein